jgi:hypothetical protein
MPWKSNIIYTHNTSGETIACFMDKDRCEDAKKTIWYPQKAR